MSASNQRFVALDLHKQYVMVAALDAQQVVVLRPRRVSLERFAEWAGKHLKSTDAVVLEATTNAWYVHDLLEPMVARVVVAHPYHVKLIASSFVKTDKRDTLALARLLAANLIPAVWVPPMYVRDLRALVSHRTRLVQQRTAAKNRLRSLLHRHQIVPPAGNIFLVEQRDWWEELELSNSEKLRACHDLAIVDHLSSLIDEVEAELARLSVNEPWADQVPFLVQLPGIGMLTAMTLLSAIGDVTRFPTAKKLVGYGGLGAGVHSSGQTHYTKSITKQGRRELRAVMLEAAWSAVRYSVYWRDTFDALARRTGRRKAIVAIARRLLVVVWHVLTEQAADRRADPAAVARSVLSWSARYRLNRSLGLTHGEFVRRRLDQLNIGQELERVKYGAYICHLPPAHQPAREMSGATQR